MPAILPPLKQALAASFESGEEIKMFHEEQEKPEKKPEEVTKVDPPEVEKKGLGEISDEPPAEPVKVEDPHEPREGEKPAQFIKRLKAEHAAAVNDAKQAREALSKKVVDPEEISALRKQLEERDAILERVAYQDTAAYQEKFGKPIAKSEQNARDLILQFTDTKGIYERAKALAGRERLDFLKEHMEEGAGAAFDRLNQVDELTKDRDAAILDKSERAKALAEEPKDDFTADVESFDKQLPDIAKRFSIYRGEEAASLIEQVKSIIRGEASSQDLNNVLAMGVAAPKWIQRALAAESKVKLLEARVAEEDGDAAHINGRGGEGGRVENGLFGSDGRLKPLQKMLRDAFKK